MSDHKSIGAASQDMKISVQDIDVKLQGSDKQSSKRKAEIADLNMFGADQENMSCSDQG